MTHLISKLITVKVCVYFMITRVREYGSYLKRMSCPITCSLYLIIVVLLFDTSKNNPNRRRHWGKKREGRYVQKWKQMIRTRWWQWILGNEFEVGVRIRCSHPRETETAEEDEDGGKNRAWQVCLPCVTAFCPFQEYTSLPRNVILCIKFPWIQPNQKWCCNFSFSSHKNDIFLWIWRQIC